jgi:hypothetical protein
MSFFEDDVVEAAVELEAPVEESIAAESEEPATDATVEEQSADAA